MFYYVTVTVSVNSMITDFKNKYDMAILHRCRSHFFYQSKNIAYSDSSRYNGLKKYVRTLVKVINDIDVHSTNKSIIFKRTNGYSEKPLTFSRTNFLVRSMNISDDAKISCNEQLPRTTKAEILKSQTAKIVFNHTNVFFLHRKPIQNNNETKLFNSGFRVNYCRKYSIVTRNSESELPISDSFEKQTDSLTSTEIEEFQEEVNRYATRSHTCGELRISDLGKEVKLCGWVAFVRMNKFILLRDAYGTTQVLIKNRVDAELNLNNLPIESVVCVRGTVIARPQSQIDTKLPTGEIEVEASSVQILNKSLSNMPFLIRDYNKPNNKLMNRYRFLALRFAELQNNLRLRSEMLFQMRNFLIAKRKFVEVETPTLFKKTPGGAQEFIVPTQYKNRFYSLVQSPQQLKQLLMVGSIDRYFQIARCYRDEKTNPERQPEFTQLDIELSFSTMEDIMKLTEEILIASWPQDKPSISTPFPKITYKDSIEKYGSDKPCLLNELLIQNLEKCIRKSNEKFIYMFSIPQAQDSYKQLKQRIDGLEHLESTAVYVIKNSKSEKMLQDLKKVLPDFESEFFTKSFTVNEGDVIVLSTDFNKEIALKALGSCRHEVIDHLNLLAKPNNETVFDFIWVVDFPLMERNEFGELKSTHHPFTHPHPEDINLIPNEAIKARSLAYDLVLNGSEIGGGSIRIHNAELQKKIFKLLNLEEKDFGHLLEALEMGCPPHGGIALGLDRLLAIICCSKSIKDVIAFPKGWEGQDLMTGCPSDVSTADKKRYHILY